MDQPENNDTNLNTEIKVDEVNPEPAAEAPIENQPPVQTPVTSDKKSNKTILILLIVLFFLVAFIAAGYYFLNFFLPSRKLEAPNQPEISKPLPTKTETSDESLEKLESQSSSDEIELIEEDLNNTDLSGLDQELPQIESELAQP